MQSISPAVNFSALSAESNNFGVPICHHGGLSLEWLQSLVDQPKEGLSLLRKKVMDLGAKVRLLGKPSGAQFQKLLQALRTLPNWSSICAESMDCILLLCGIIETLENPYVIATIFSFLTLQLFPPNVRL
jgi:hypothetical protein